MIAAYKLRAVPSTSTTATSRTSCGTCSRTRTSSRSSTTADTPRGWPRCSPTCPRWPRIVVIDDESDADVRRLRRRPVRGGARRVVSPERDFGARERRRHLHALHRRHDRLPQGRDLAPRGRLAGARRRHRLHDRHAGGGRVGAVAGAASRWAGWCGSAWRRSSTATRSGPRCAALFAGDTVVLLPTVRPARGLAGHRAPQGQRRRPHRRRHGPADDRGLRRRRATTARRCSRSPAAPRCSRPRSRTQYLEALPNVMVTDVDRLVGDRLRRHRDRRRRRAPADGPRVTPGPDTIVVDDDGRPPAAGRSIGRLARGGHVPLGYYKDPAKTAALFIEVDGARYAMPGDLARLEDDGTITLLGRGNTCVNTGGEKVFPDEVEGALKSHPDVFDALVIGVPDERLGQRVAALVQPRPGPTPDLAALDAHVREQIAGYKVPRSVWLVDADQPHPQRQGRLPLGAPYAEQHTDESPDRPGMHCAPTLCDAARHRAPDRRLHPVRARRGGDQPGRRARRARLRPLQRRRRARRRADLAGREHRRPAVRRGRRDAHPRARPRARRSTWTS